MIVQQSDSDCVFLGSAARARLRGPALLDGRFTALRLSSETCRALLGDKTGDSCISSKCHFARSSPDKFTKRFFM